VLRRAGALNDPQLAQLDKHRHPKVRNHAGSIVGEIDLVTP